MGLFSKYSRSYDDGKQLMEEGNYKLALEKFDECIETHGYDSYILQLKAFCLMQLEDYDEAIECYEIILEDYNYDLDRMVLNNIGIAYNKINKPETAIEYFDEGIEYYPDYIDFWINKGYSLLALEEYDESLECYEEALKIDFSNNAAKEGYGYLCKKLGIEGEDFFDAEKVFYNKNHDSISGLSASSYMEGESNISVNREDEVKDDVFLDRVSDDDLDKLDQLVVSELDNASDNLDKLHPLDLSDLDGISADDLDNLHHPHVSELGKVSDDDLNQIHSMAGSDEDITNEPYHSKDFKFCHKCGTKLDKDDIFCCNCGTKLKVEVICDSCGAKLKEGDVFCKKCGNKLK